MYVVGDTQSVRSTGIAVLAPSGKAVRMCWGCSECHVASDGNKGVFALFRWDGRELHKQIPSRISAFSV